MSNQFGLEDNQEVVITIGFEDVAGNAVPDAIDAGSLTAVFADGTEVSATVNADNTITVTALGPLTSDDVLTVSCTVNGTPFTGTAAFTIGTSVPTGLTLTEGTPTTETPAAAPAPTTDDSSSAGVAEPSA